MRLLFGIICILVLTQCCEEGDGGTHTLKGSIKHAILENNMSQVDIQATDRTCPFSPGIGCEQLRLDFKSDLDGTFDFSYESCCDVFADFNLSDSLKNIYGKCFRWDYQDLNDNEVQLGGCGREPHNTLMTVRESNYNFLVQFQPQLFLYFISKENPDLEFKMIEIEKLGIASDSLFNMNDFYDITELKDELEIKVTYANDSVIVQTLEYDYLEDCRREFTFDI